MHNLLIEICKNTDFEASFWFGGVLGPKFPSPRASMLTLCLNYSTATHTTPQKV